MADNIQKVGIELVAEDGGFKKNTEAAKKVMKELITTFEEASLKGAGFGDKIGSSSGDIRAVAADLKKASTNVKLFSTATSSASTSMNKYTNEQNRLKGTINLTEAELDGMKATLQALRSEQEQAGNAVDETSIEYRRQVGLIQKTESELEELRISLRRNSTEYDKLTGDIGAYTIAERASTRVMEASNEVYSQNYLVKEKYVTKLQEQAIKTEQLRDALQQEEIEIENLTKALREQNSIADQSADGQQKLIRLSEEGEKSLKARVANHEKLRLAMKTSENQTKSYVRSLNLLNDGNVIAAQRAKAAFRAIEEQGQGIRDIGFTIQDAGLAMSAFVTIPFAASLGASVKAAIDFETSFTGILKTVDGVVQAGTLSKLTEQGEELRREMLELALVIPATNEELNNVAEVAGQLGVAAKDIAEFTRVVVEFSEATNVTSEDASKAFAQVFNVFKQNLNGTDIVDFADASSNAIVDLGNNFATTESEILHFFQTFAGGAAAFDVAAEDALAIATAFKSVRAQTASSSTGIQKTFLNMANAVESGSQTLYDFAEVSGVTADEFSATWRSRPAEAFRLFLSGLNEAGDQAPNILKSLGLGDVRIQREFLKAAGGADVLKEAMDLAAGAFGNFGAQGARAEEAARRFATTESQIRLLKNELNNLAITIGTTFLPIIRDMASDLRPVISALTELAGTYPGMVKFTTGLLGVVAVIGPLSVGLGRTIALIGGFKAGVGSLGLGIKALELSMSATGGAAGDMVDEMKSVTGVTKALGKALNITGGSLLAFGATAVGLALVATAIAAIAIQVRNANKEFNEIQKSTDAAVTSIKTMNEAQLKSLSIIVSASDSFDDYSTAIKIAGYSVGELTEGEYDLIKANGETADSLSRGTVAVATYARELKAASDLVKLFSSFKAPTLTALTAIDEDAEGLEEYLSLLGELKKATEEDIGGEVIFQDADVASEIFEDLVSRTSDMTVVSKALIDTFGGEVAAINALTTSLKGGGAIQADYNRGAIDFVDVLNRLQAGNDNYRTGLSATITEIKKYTGELTEAELVIVGLAHEEGKRSDQIASIIGKQRQYIRSLIQIATAQEELKTGVEGIITLAEAQSDAGAFGGIVEGLFGEGLDDGLESVQELASAYSEFLELSQEDAGGVADSLAGIAEATEELKGSFAIAALEAEKLRLEAEGFSPSEIAQATLDYSRALGILSTSEAVATQQLLDLNYEMQELITAFHNGVLSTKQKAAAIELLAGGYVKTAGDAYTLVQASEELVDSTLAAQQATDGQAAAMEDASASALELAQEYVKVADAQNKIAETGSKGIRKMFESVTSGASTASSSVTKSVDDMSKSYVGFIETVQDGEQPVENWATVLLDSSVAAGASLEQIVALTIATGELSDEQAKGLLNQVAAIKAVEGIADAYVNGSLTADEAAAAVKGMQEQIEAGGSIDLSQYGVYLNKVEEIGTATGSSAAAVKTAQEEIAESVVGIVGEFEELSDAEIRELEVQFGIIDIDQADAENKYQNALEAMRLAFGQTFVDGVPVRFGLEVLGIENFDKYMNELYDLAQQGADVAGAVELIIGVSTDLELTEVESEQFFNEVTTALEAQPGLAAIEVVAQVVTESGLAEEALGADLANLADRGLEVSATFKDVGLKQYLLEVQEQTDTIAEEGVVHDVVFASNLKEEGIGVIPEVEELQLLLTEITGEGNDWKVVINDDSIVAAISGIKQVTDDLANLDGKEATIRVNVEVDNIPSASDFGGDTTTGSSIPNNYHGGLASGKIGRDKFLSWVSNGEYIMPNYVTNKPGVLAALEKIKGSGGAWTPTVGQQRFSANSGNGAISNISSDNSVRNRKNVTINIHGDNGGNTRSRMLAFTNLNRV